MTDIRTATGFDSHRFGNSADGTTTIMLGGVAIPHDKPVDAHSDGDVALHALTDALFGLIADGDIGTHFPPDDEKWKDAPSQIFLEAAAAKLRDAGGMLTLVDITIICDAPKITPHRDAMREAIAGMLALEVARVSVKATTTEGMGAIADNRGIAAIATATARFTEAAT